MTAVHCWTGGTYHSAMFRNRTPHLGWVSCLITLRWNDMAQSRLEDVTIQRRLSVWDTPSLKHRSASPISEHHLRQTHSRHIRRRNAESTACMHFAISGRNGYSTTVVNLMISFRCFRQLARFRRSTKGRSHSSRSAPRPSMRRATIKLLSRKTKGDPTPLRHGIEELHPSQGSQLAQINKNYKRSPI